MHFYVPVFQTLRLYLRQEVLIVLNQVFNRVRHIILSERYNQFALVNLLTGIFTKYIVTVTCLYHLLIGGLINIDFAFYSIVDLARMLKFF
jgi:hypothetical protein